MSEPLALALASTGVALSYAADGPRGVARWSWLAIAARARLARWLALVLSGLALVIWNASEPGPAAFLAVPLALLAAGTVISLGAPTLRRALRRKPRRGRSRQRPARATTLDPSAPATAALEREARAGTRATLERALLVLSVTLGPLPVALLTSAALARFLPVSSDARFATGFGLAIPLWLLGMCSALLARRSAVVLGVCATLGLVLAALVFGIRP